MPRLANLISIAAVLLAAVIFGWLFFRPAVSMPLPTQNITRVTIGTTAVAVEVADTDAVREQGLSGRAALGEGSGMLFVFDVPGNYGFWMKDMHFSLDILFADENGKIVSIYRDLSPDSYTKSPPEVFYPASPSRYVLEVPAGFAASHSIEEGMTFKVEP